MSGIDDQEQAKKCAFDVWINGESFKELGDQSKHYIIFYVSGLLKEIGDLKALIRNHNEQCIELCGDKSNCGYKGYDRNCTSCSTDWMIDDPILSVEICKLRQKYENNQS